VLGPSTKGSVCRDFNAGHCTVPDCCVSLAPTPAPTTVQPTKAPTTKQPTKAPTTGVPTQAPVNTPSWDPTAAPTGAPTKAPTTTVPTAAPTSNPTATPTKQPTSGGTTFPTYMPTAAPVTSKPTAAPTTKAPTVALTFRPTPGPIISEAPTKAPTHEDPTLGFGIAFAVIGAVAAYLFLPMICCWVIHPWYLAAFCCTSHFRRFASHAGSPRDSPCSAFAVLSPPCVTNHIISLPLRRDGLRAPTEVHSHIPVALRALRSTGLLRTDEREAKLLVPSLLHSLLGCQRRRY